MQRIAPAHFAHVRYQLGSCEYMLLANPNKNVGERVSLEKKAFKKWLRQAFAIISQPHITLAKFSASEDVEALLCQCIQNVCGLQHCFAVVLNNFKGFWPHTIYIHVHNREPFERFAANLSRIENLIPAHKFRITFLVDKPHMTIARGLEKEMYDAAIALYSQLTFYDLFTLNKIVLLKRKSSHETWQPVKEFSFQEERTLFN